MLYDGDIIEHDGARFRVEFPFDDSSCVPPKNIGWLAIERKEPTSA